MKQLVVLTGAGISAESGLKTFRDQGGLWENYDVMEVASIQGWHKNPALVLSFYNDRRSQLARVDPNLAHQALVELEKYYQVHIVTQNVDDLHERAGSSKVLHLHGELLKCRSESNAGKINGQRIKTLQPDDQIEIGDLCDMGFQIRPHIVWFGEEVPAMEEAISICSKADILLIVGTSLQVYPAASLVQYVKRDAQKIVVDPSFQLNEKGWVVVQEKASKGVSELVKQLIDAAHEYA